ncbi:MAG TPA: hypothetical protein VMU27_01765 [Candidatus Paceibacterota bacterium]|nr:hypothetical protein [Candidatus Paceibacterota bacterium]
MTILSITVFGLSLIAIMALFVLKQWEVGSGRVIASSFRMSADEQALALKQRLFHLRLDLARIPPLTLLYLRYFIHEAALSFAALARWSEQQAHKLADFVSHKHTFVPRETRSDFLRKVSNYKSGNGDSDRSAV